MSRASDLCLAYAERVEELADEFAACAKPQNENEDYRLRAALRSLRRARDDLADSADEIESDEETPSG